MKALYSLPKVVSYGQKDNTMREFNVQLFELRGDERPNSGPGYMIALSPSSRKSGAQGTKHYLSKEAFATDLKEYLGFCDAAIRRFFFRPNAE
jgi:hypothetical protein